MPAKPNDGGQDGKLKMFALRLDPELSGRVEIVAAALGLNPTAFLRSAIVAVLPTYEDKVMRMVNGKPKKGRK